MNDVFGTFLETLRTHGERIEQEVVDALRRKREANEALSLVKHFEDLTLRVVALERRPLTVEERVVLSGVEERVTRDRADTPAKYLELAHRALVMASGHLDAAVQLGCREADEIEDLTDALVVRVRVLLEAASRAT